MSNFQVVDFDQWYAENEEELMIEAAERGLDRELDFDFESWVEDKYFAINVVGFVEHSRKNRG